MPGPKPTPTKILECRGSWRAKSRRGEPTPEIGVPKCPRWLSQGGRRYWKEIAGHLKLMGVAAKCDQVAMALLAEAMSQYIDARDVVERTGVVSVTDKGNEVQNPAVGARNKAWENVLKICREFGLTPASRPGLAVRDRPESKSKPAAKQEERFFRSG